MSDRVPHAGVTGQRPALLWVVLATSSLFAVAVASILAATGGRFTYTLDDPYIHLALSEQIRQLHYGINAGEAATPSSSVLWPFPLALTAGTPLHPFTPLLLAFAATLASGSLLLHLLTLVTDGAARRRPVLSAALVMTVLVLLNGVGVAFTGLEHSAHITACLAVGVGLVELSLRRVVPWWLLAGIVVGPGLRYEGVAVAGAGALVLFWYGFRARAVLALLASLVPLVVFSAAALSQGLAPLPSSVLVKSAVASGSGSTAGAVVDALRAAAGNPVFTLLVAGVVADLVVRGWRRASVLHVYALGVLGAHAVAGQFGWFGRYELYAYAAVLPVAALLARSWVTALLTTGRVRHAAAAAVVALAVTTGYLQTSALTPFAARNIHQQQAQMARFATDYWPQPVAVNDLGLVAYESPQHVLDLWGLASEEAREARASQTGTAWMEELAQQHDVGLAMIYAAPAWFPEVPPSWTPVARLVLDGPKVTVAEDVVTFYATSAADVGPLREALTRFAPTVPAGARVELAPPP